MWDELVNYFDLTVTKEDIKKYNEMKKKGAVKMTVQEALARLQRIVGEYENLTDKINKSCYYEEMPIREIKIMLSELNELHMMIARKNEYIKLLNVKISLQIGSGSTWGHLIQKECLIQIISELIKPESGTRTLTMGSANTAKLADTYVKLLEDDGSGKYPFELCESTVEGAMTITDYCLYKNWQLA